MSTFIEIRRWERPDRPQPVYTGALSLWEAYRYVPIGDSQRNVSFCTPGRRDRTFAQQTIPSFGWVQFVVDGRVSTWASAFRAALASGVWTPDRPRLDVRRSEWSSSAWITANLPPATDVLWPAILNGIGLSYRSRERSRLDVRDTAGSPSAWIQATLPFPADIVWPAILQGTGLSYRSRERAPLPVPDTTGSPGAWIQATLPSPPPATDVVWPAILTGMGLSYRSREGRQVNVRDTSWSSIFTSFPALPMFVVGTPWQLNTDGYLASTQELNTGGYLAVQELNAGGYVATQELNTGGCVAVKELNTDGISVGSNG